MSAPQKQAQQPPPDGLPLAAPLASLAWLERLLSMPLIFALLGIATFVIAWNRGIALLYALFAVLVGAALFSLVGARLMLRAATVRFQLPVQASVGDCISVQVAILPQTWPFRRHLLQLNAPYPFAPGQHVFLPLCGRDLVRQQRVVCTRRGLFRLQDVSVASAYPLGLATVRRRWAAVPAGITIHPRIYPGTAFSLPASSARSSVDMERPAPSLGQELFREVREYRRGDNPRHIHWRSSARQGHLVVKQFDAVTTSETWIVLDLDPASHAGQGQDHSFERAIEIAASIAAQQIRAGLRCGIAGGLRADGSPALLLAPQTGSAHLHAMLDALAAVCADCAVPYATVLEGLAAHHSAGQQWILFQHGEERIAAPPFLRKQRAPFWFRFDTASFADDDVSRRNPLPPQRQSDGFAITRDSDLARIFNA